MRTLDCRLLGLMLVALAGAVPCARAQSPIKAGLDSLDIREREVRRQRQGAGLRVGAWQTTGLSQVAGATYSTIPAFEGYWQRGLDRHVVLETSAGLWGRTQHSGTDRVGSFLVPMLTAVKLYPFTGPADQLEPFLMAGAGFTIGVDDRNTTTGGGLLGGTASNSTVLIVGVGVKGAVGLEYRLGRAFGLSGGAGYTFVRFLGGSVGDDDTYKGVVLTGGLTYRFQY